MVRPTLDPAKKKRRNFTFRGTDQLHEELSKASAANARSISIEIEARLKDSFKLTDIERIVELAVYNALKRLASVEEVARAIATDLHGDSNLTAMYDGKTGVAWSFYKKTAESAIDAAMK